MAETYYRVVEQVVVPGLSARDRLKPVTTAILREAGPEQPGPMVMESLDDAEGTIGGASELDNSLGITIIHMPQQRENGLWHDMEKIEGLAS